MAKIGIVTTSINKRPSIYERWAQVGELIVAGDRNSPPDLHAYVEGELGGDYVTPSAQDALWTFSKYIGWNCIQRRNTAIMQAMFNHHDYVVTVDDDNYPLPNVETFLAGHLTNLHQTHSSFVHSPSGFLNTGTFTSPQFHQRGVPYGVDTSSAVILRRINDAKVVVSQAQVLGDPDCDAVERIANAPDVLAVKANVVVMPGTYAAFNSQATVWTREWVPVMAVLPGIGRYDDIFASYIFARLARTYDVALFVGEPCMRQVRNDHNLASDLRQELWGMNHVFTFCRALDNAHISADMPLHVAYGELILACENVLPAQTINFAREWIAAWREIA